MLSTPTRRYDASGRQASARARRRAVVDAARALFLDHGYGPTSIAAIAQAAGVSAPTVYATFGSKAGILNAVVGVAVAGDHEEGLARERPDAVALRGVRGLDEWIEAAAHFTRTIHERSAALLHLVTGVAGTDPAVAELETQIIAGQRTDILLYVTQGPLAGARPDLDDQQKADILQVLTGVDGWRQLVWIAGWTPDEYEAWLADTVGRVFAP